MTSTKTQRLDEFQIMIPCFLAKSNKIKNCLTLKIIMYYETGKELRGIALLSIKLYKEISSATFAGLLYEAVAK